MKYLFALGLVLLASGASADSSFDLSRMLFQNALNPNHNGFLTILKPIRTGNVTVRIFKQTYLRETENSGIVSGNIICTVNNLFGVYDASSGISDGFDLEPVGEKQECSGSLADLGEVKVYPNSNIILWAYTDSSTGNQAKVKNFWFSFVTRTADGKYLSKNSGFGSAYTRDEKLGNLSLSVTDRANVDFESLPIGKPVEALSAQVEFEDKVGN